MMKLLAIVICSIFAFCMSAYAGEGEVHLLRVRGVVKALPGSGLAANEILVKHEPIPDYRDESGKVVGMMAMTMPFFLDKSVSLDGISVGDSVEMLVEQHIKPRFSDNVVAMKKVSPTK